MSGDANKKEDARLNLPFIPNHYEISYERIDLKTFEFAGTVEIQATARSDVDVAAFANSVTIHCLEVQIIEAKLHYEEITLAAEKLHYHVRNQTCKIVFPSTSPLWQKGRNYILKVSFRGELNDKLCGLYRSTYVDVSDGTSKIIATTQFEPTDARRAFPCFDEPALKATFSLTVRAPVDLQVISNTPPEAVFTEPNRVFKRVKFQQTPRMSTYLVALVMGKFDSVSATTFSKTYNNRITTTVYTVPGKAEQGVFCLDTAARCLDFYQDEFGIPYPLTKSDLLALPDFGAGAMENWGCVTYREAKILVQPGSTSESMKRGIARTVCHELAHQWFGNLATMEFWTQLYLKEGVARYMEFVGIDHLFPEWQAWTEFVQSVYTLALSLDALNTSHPVEVEVHHPDEISEIFDAISYAKGASLIRMVASYIGKEAFRKGMQTYLQRFAYDNAVTNDLWQALEEAADGKSIVDFMHPWTRTMGFPIVILQNDGSFQISRFLASGPASDEDECPWQIPITVQVQGSEEVEGPFLIGGGNDPSVLSSKLAPWTEAGKWFKLNVDQTAFCRIAYSAKQRSAIQGVLEPTSSPLTLTDRLGLISDSFAAGMAGYTSLVDALKLVQDFGSHDTADYVVWQELSENLSSVARVFRSESFFGKLQAFLASLYRKQYDLLGWEAKPDETPRTATLRSTVIEMMGMAGDTSVKEQAMDYFLDLTAPAPSRSVPGDLQRVIFKLALKYDEATVCNTLKGIYETVDGSPEEKRNCLTTIGSVVDPTRHAEMMDYVLFSGKVRLQDMAFPLGALATTSDERGKATWAYLRDNFDSLQDKYADGPMWGSIVGLSCRGLTRTSEADEVEAFFEGRTGSATRRLSQALEIVRTRAQRRDRDRDALQRFLEQNAST